MLTDEQIEEIIYNYTSRQDEFNLSVISIIAERLSRIADFDNLNVLERAQITRKETLLIENLYSDYVKKQKKRIKDDFWLIATIVYLDSMQFYENQLRLELNKILLDSVEQITKEAQASLMSLLSTPVFVIRDLQNPGNLIVHNLAQTYQTVVNEALTYNNLPRDLRDAGLKRTEMQLFDSGVRYMIKDPNEGTRYTTSADRAIRFNILDSIKNLINTMQDIMGEQFGANAVELSAHVYPAPDHAPAQGHQFSLKEVDNMQSGKDFKDLQGNTYIGFDRNIGQWNCRHYFMKIKRGAEPTYTQKQLDKILKDNQQGYTDANGKHRTLYECTQVQRRYEREIRRAKEKYLYGKALGDAGIMATARNRVGTLTTQYKHFSNSCGIPAKLERIRVKDYK